MSKKAVVIMPGTQAILSTMGEQIKMARLRRNLSAALVAERAGIREHTKQQFTSRGILPPFAHFQIRVEHDIREFPLRTMLQPRFIILE